MIEELLKYTCGQLEKKNIEYMLSGSIAMTIYATPRFTRDIDIVINLKKEDVNSFISIFTDTFYINNNTVLEEIEKKGMFNVIDQNSGYKIDFIIKKETDFRNEEFRRKVYKPIFNFNAWIVSPEDLFISKIIWIQSSPSDMQMSDLRALINHKAIDKKYISDWCTKLKLLTYNLI